MEPQETKTSKSNYLIPISIVIAGVLIAGAVWFQSGQKVDTTATAGGKKAVKVDLGDLPILGESKAKVNIVIFGDYQCPFCERLFKEVEPLIREQYVKSGQVKMAWHDFAFLGSESFWAAEAARCANDQGKFWQYHDLLFNRQNGENKGTFVKENLKSFAAELGLNQQEFNSCLDSDKYAQAVRDDTDYGKTLGVDSTPYTFVSGEGVIGSQPFAIFKALIEKK